MSNLLSLTAEIVSAHASNTQMTTDELYQEIENVFASLKALENGTSGIVPEQSRQLTLKQAFKKDEVVCMVCGKGGFKTLKRHLTMAHGLKPGEYRKQFGIPSTQSLAAKSYSESRRQMAIDKGLGDGLARARAKKAAVSTAIEKSRASVPMVRVKAPVPVKIEVAKVPKKAKKSGL